LGLASYYRKFIEKFADIAAPLTLLTRKDQDWKWEEAQETAYQTLVEQLTRSPTLATPDFTKPFKLTTDGSGVGISAILSQELWKDGHFADHPIAYASRTLTQPERNYSATCIEGLAAVWGVEYFHHYLAGRRFTLYRIYTDHSAPVSIFTKNAPQTYSMTLCGAL
jgi:hypothetical protein